MYKYELLCRQFAALLWPAWGVILKAMLYVVGTRIDLTHMNDARKNRAVRVPQPGRILYEAGTRFSFLKTAQGLIITAIAEPPLRLQVAVL